MSESRRGLGTWPDLLRSMGLVTIVVLILSASVWWPREQAKPLPVDVAAIALGAEKQASFQPVVPQLPYSWEANAARIEPATGDLSRDSWHVGYISEGGKYFAVEQSDTVLVEEFIRRWTEDFTEVTTRQFGNLTWREFTKGEESAFVIAVDEVTTIALVGDNSDTETFLQAISKSLA